MSRYPQLREEEYDPSPDEQARILKEIAELRASKVNVPQMGKAGPDLSYNSRSSSYGLSAIRVCHDPRRMSFR